MAHSKVIINRENGETAQAIAPFIISASRSTDIPAFYADWFFHRLDVGYCGWRNPFNQAVQYVSFANTKCVVFWSKNPRPLIPYLDRLKEKGIDCYIQYTLNDYELAGYEPNLPQIGARIETFHMLVEKLGKGKVIWRYDPILISQTYGQMEVLDNLIWVGNQIYDVCEKLVFSFADISNYKRVQYNLQQAGIKCREPTIEEMNSMCETISVICKRDWGIEAATCGERVDFSQYGISHNRCIDPDLMSRHFSYNTELMRFLDYNGHKDTGQRPACGCILSKDIGSYHTCGHGCKYCYANASPEIGFSNCAKSIGRYGEIIM